MIKQINPDTGEPYTVQEREEINARISKNIEDELQLYESENLGDFEVYERMKREEALYSESTKLMESDEEDWGVE